LFSDALEVRTHRVGPKFSKVLGYLLPEVDLMIVQ